MTTAGGRVKTPAPQRAAGRRQLAAKKQALPGGTAPIPNVAYLKKAIRAKGRVDPAKWPALKALIRKRATQLKATGAPGVKGTWAFQGANSGRAIELVGPKGYVHGWHYEGPERKGELVDHLGTADKMSKEALTKHLNSYHAGTPAVGRRVGPKNPSKAQLLAQHEMMHDPSQRPPGVLVAMPFAHTHGIGKPGTTTTATGAAAKLAATHGKMIDLVGPGGWSHGWVKAGDAGALHGYVLVGKDRRGNEHTGYFHHPSQTITPHAGTGQQGEPVKVRHVRKLDGGAPPSVSRLAHPSNTAADQHGKVIDMATATMTRRMPVVRGGADVQMTRSGPGKVTVMHKSSGVKVGTLAQTGKGWQGVHASGAKCPPSGTMSGAVAGLVAAHNQLARGKKLPPAQKDGTASYAHEAGDGISLAGALPHSTPASSASDGPRVTTGGSGPGGLTGEAAAVYAKLIKKGLKPGQAAALARRAAAMHAKAAGPKASAA